MFLAVGIPFEFLNFNIYGKGEEVADHCGPLIRMERVGFGGQWGG